MTREYILLWLVSESKHYTFSEMQVLVSSMVQLSSKFSDWYQMWFPVKSGTKCAHLPYIISVLKLIISS